jgi:O-antigen/teichoic acid export membrane protein
LIEDIGRGIKYNTLGTSIFILTGLLISILIVRGIGKDEYGLFIFVMAIFMLLSPIYNLGLTIPLTRYISEYRTKGELGKIRTLILKSLKLKLLSWIIVSPIVLCFWHYLYPETFAIAIILVFIALLTAINGTFISSLEPFYEQKLLNKVAIIGHIFYLLLP